MASKEKLRVVILLSGSGSTAEKIIKATVDDKLHIKDRLLRTEVVGVIGSTRHAKGLEKAQAHGVPFITVIDPLDFKRAGDKNWRFYYGEAMNATLDPLQPDIIGQHGHTPLTPENVVQKYFGKMINQHPGKVDPSKYDFGGKGMVGALRVKAAELLFDRWTGHRNPFTDVVTQWVAVEFDKGRVLRRRRIYFEKHDDPYSLQDRSLPEEHQNCIETYQDFENGTIQEQPTYEEMGIDLVRRSERWKLMMSKFVAQKQFPL